MSRIDSISDKKLDIVSLEPKKSSEATSQEVFKPSKPHLAELDQTHVEPPSLIFSRMFDAMQDYISSISEAIIAKQHHIGSSIANKKQDLRAADQKVLGAKKSIETWDARKKLANYMFHGVSLLSGTALVCTGQTVAGSSMIVSSVGSAASEVMKSYNFNEKLTAATSIISGVIGIAGGLGTGLYNLLTSPQRVTATLSSPIFKSITQWALPITTAVASGFNQFATIKKNENLENLSAIEALHTRSETALKSVQQKFSGSIKTFGSRTKDFSQEFKTILRAQSRYRQVMREVTNQV